MGGARNAKSRVDFQCRYDAYARNHGMTREQMLTHDRQCSPDALLKPFLLWASDKRLEWNALHSESKAVVSEVDFDQWLDHLSPALNVLTCECHKKLWS